MPKCKFCKREINKTNSCNKTVIEYKGKIFEPIKYGDEKNYLGNKELPCNVCKVIKGQYHHVGCNNEECPICQGQIISCDCFYK